MQCCNINHITRLQVQSSEVKCFCEGHIRIACMPTENHVGFVCDQAWDHFKRREKQMCSVPSLSCRNIYDVNSLSVFYMHVHVYVWVYVCGMGWKYILCARAEMCELYRVCEWLGLSVYSSISGGALRFRILPIMAVIKINKQLIDRPCFQFPPIISGAMSHSREDSFKQFTHTTPRGSNKKQTQKLSGEKKNNHRGVIVLFFFAVIFRFFILTFCIIQINEAQRGGLTGIVLAVHALTPQREMFHSAWLSLVAWS